MVTSQIRLNSLRRCSSFVVVPPNGYVNCPWPAWQCMAPTNEHFVLRVVENFEPGAPQHRFDAGAIWNPPVGRIAGVPFFNEKHFRETCALERVHIPKSVVVINRLNLIGPTLQRLKDKKIA